MKKANSPRKKVRKKHKKPDLDALNKITDIVNKGRVEKKKPG